jgi:peptidoglycan/xylan/chitin deacetylase (PgdA/CDA1 family)
MRRLARYALETLSPEGSKGRLTVLIFHRVQRVPDPLFPEAPDAQAFTEILERWGQWFSVVPLSEALDRLKRRALPPRALAITFDDGYADNFTIALPILERLRMPATFFVAAGYLDGGRMFNDTVVEAVRRFDGDTLELAHLGLGAHGTATLAARRRTIENLITRIKYLHPRERDEKVLAIAQAARSALPDDLMLSSTQLRMLHRAGMGVGGHTLNHPILSRLSGPEARAEIALGKERLEGLLGEPINLFAYPNGKPGNDFGSEHVQMVRDLGFRAAFSTAPGAARTGDDLHQLPRFTPWQQRPLRQLGQFCSNLRRRDFCGAAVN